MNPSVLHYLIYHENLKFFSEVALNLNQVMYTVKNFTQMEGCLLKTLTQQLK